MSKYNKNWRTTLIGWTLVIGGIVTGFTAKQSWTEASIVITMGVGFIMAKDA